MSKITTVFDRVLVELAAIFPNHTRIPNAYNVEVNDDNFLRQGYGLKVGPSSRVDLEFCSLAFERTLTVVICRECFNTGSNETVYDDIVKALMEDIYLVQDRFNEPDQLAIETSIVKIDPSSQSEVTEIGDGETKFLTMQADFIFTIRENI